MRVKVDLLVTVNRQMGITETCQATEPLHAHLLCPGNKLFLHELVHTGSQVPTLAN